MCARGTVRATCVGTTACTAHYTTYHSTLVHTESRVVQQPRGYGKNAHMMNGSHEHDNGGKDTEEVSRRPRRPPGTRNRELAEGKRHPHRGVQCPHPRHTPEALARLRECTGAYGAQPSNNGQGWQAEGGYTDKQSITASNKRVVLNMETKLQDNMARTGTS